MKVFVIIVTYNGMKWIEECLKSISESSIPLSIIVVDNNSSDETTAFIKNNFPDVVLFEQTANLGFGKANNLGLSYALKQNADFVFLLNQDAFLEKHTAEKLIKVSKESKEYGILSPIQLDYSGKNLEYYFSKFMAEDSSGTFYSDFVVNNELKPVYDVSFIQAAAWLLPIETVKKIGGFDPIFYHYGEDNNYCQRLEFHKMKIGVVPNTFIRHDSHKPKRENIDLFSAKYFNFYLREIFFKYADINKTYGKREINKEKKKAYKLIIMSLMNFKPQKALGYLKQLRLFKSKIKDINYSRSTNKNIYPNHIEIE
ncbi:N-acetylglucosaminyl-diphospho-decaprenol L-rhamnosyltransferase [compost metagenome]